MKYNSVLLSVIGERDKKIKWLLVLLVNLSLCHLDVMDGCINECNVTATPRAVGEAEHLDSL